MTGTGTRAVTECSHETQTSKSLPAQDPDGKTGTATAKQNEQNECLLQNFPDGEAKSTTT